MFDSDNPTRSDGKKRAWRIAGVAEGVALGAILLAGAAWGLSLRDERMGDPEAAPGYALQAPSPTELGGTYTVYIVGSEAQASALRRSLEEGDNVRHSLGLSPVQEEVLVAEGPSHALVMERALNEGNLILAGFGVDGRVVNLAV